MTKPQAKSQRKGRTNGHRRKAATAAEILGQRPAATVRQNRTVPTKWAPYYRKLIGLRHELRGKIDDRSSSIHTQAQSFSMHMADSGTDSIDRDYTLSLLQSEKDALYEIDEAIQRIHDGTYGICELTEEPISEARLWAVPWARYSLKAQRKLESSGVMSHPHLGTLSSVHAASEAAAGQEEGPSSEAQGEP